VRRIFRHRSTLLAFLSAVVLVATPLASRAALDVAVGAREVVKSEPLSSCNTKAKNALNSVLQDAAEVGGGDTGEWKAYGAPDAAGNSSAAAAIHCYPVDTGYLVTFTCAVQMPPNSDNAATLCSKLSAAFDAKASALVVPLMETNRGRL
jgi:hypothetical protein